MEHRRKLIHITKMPIRWGDMDAYGHVNNTIYFRYMEQARVEWIEDMIADRVATAHEYIYDDRIDGWARSALANMASICTARSQ